MGTVGLTLPIFWIGLLSLIVGSLWLGWFPAGGRFDLSLIKPTSVTGFLTIDSLLEGDLVKFGAALNYLALPAFCLSFYPAAQVCSVLLAKGPAELTTIITGMRAWMETHEYESITQMKGSLSQKSCPEPTAFERANYMKALTSFTSEFPAG